MKEQLIVKFKLPMIYNLSLINIIVKVGFDKTGNKFSVLFHGSKGYLSNVEISCEGYQTEENIIWIEKLRNKNGCLKSIMINVFYSEKNGIRVSTGNDLPRIIV